MSHPHPLPAAMHEQPLANATTRAIELALRPPTPDGDGPLRDVVRRLCADARRLRMRPEELIVLFKTRWRAEAGPVAVSPQEANAALDQMITMCIEEYYGTR